MTKAALFGSQVKLAEMRIRNSFIVRTLIVAAIATAFGTIMTMVNRTTADVRQPRYLEDSAMIRLLLFSAALTHRD